MPTKNIYVSESDLAVWEEAQSRLKGSISSLVISCIRKRLEKMKVEMAELEKISFKKSGQRSEPAFFGTWLVHPDKELKAETDNSGVLWALGITYALARTSKGRLAVLRYSGDGTAELEHYDDFEDMKAARIDSGRYSAYPENVLDAFAAVIDEDSKPILDI